MSGKRQFGDNQTTNLAPIRSVRETREATSVGTWPRVRSVKNFIDQFRWIAANLSFASQKYIPPSFLCIDTNLGNTYWAGACAGYEHQCFLITLYFVFRDPTGNCFQLEKSFFFLLFSLEFTVLSTNIYVGNLSWSTTDSDLQALFSQYGQVNSAHVIEDRETGRSRGFGFVEMDEEGARQSIQALNGADFQGRSLKVNEAQPRQSRPAGRSRY